MSALARPHHVGVDSMRFAEYSFGSAIIRSYLHLLLSSTLGSVSLMLSLWWICFLTPNAEALHDDRARAFNWRYGRFVVFASLAALGALLEDFKRALAAIRRIALTIAG